MKFFTFSNSSRREKPKKQKSLIKWWTKFTKNKNKTANKLKIETLAQTDLKF